MYQIPWIGRLEFDDRQGRRWGLKHYPNNLGLTLVGPDREPIQVKHKNDLPVLELLVQHSVGESAAAKTGLLNVDIYDIIWGQAERGLASSARAKNDRTASDNVVRIITRLRALLGGDDNIESIDYGYNFAGTNVELHAEGRQRFAPRTPRAMVPISGLVVGREAEIETALRTWLTNRQRPLLIWGPPGMGKSTLALALLNHSTTVEQFGERRYWLRCDGYDSAAAVKRGIGQQWFDIAHTPSLGSAGSPGTVAIENHILQCLGEGPSALVLDNFETPHEGDATGSENWLRSLLGVENVWLIVTRSGKEKPGGLHWTVPIEPTPLSHDDAQELFCEITANSMHRLDPRLDRLIQDLDGIPLAIELLAHLAIGEDLGTLMPRWNVKGTLLLERMGGRSRDTSLPRAYEFVIGSLNTNERRLLSILACLPIGIPEDEVARVMPGLDTDLPLAAAHRLKRGALVFEENGRLRLLSPTRDYVRRRHRVADADIRKARLSFLTTPLVMGDWAFDPASSSGIYTQPEFVRLDALRLSAELPNIEWALSGLPREENSLRSVVIQIFSAFDTFGGFISSTSLSRAQREAGADELTDLTNCVLWMSRLAQHRERSQYVVREYLKEKGYDSTRDGLTAQAYRRFYSSTSRDDHNCDVPVTLANKILTDADDPVGRSLDLASAAASALTSRKYDDATTMFSQALTISQEQSLVLFVAYNLHDLGRAAFFRELSITKPPRFDKEHSDCGADHMTPGNSRYATALGHFQAASQVYEDLKEEWHSLLVSQMMAIYYREGERMSELHQSYADAIEDEENLAKNAESRRLIDQARDYRTKEFFLRIGIAGYEPASRRTQSALSNLLWRS